MEVPVIKIAISPFPFASLACTSVVSADDHLFEATQHGLSGDSQPFQVNPAGKVAT